MEKVLTVASQIDKGFVGESKLPIDHGVVITLSLETVLSISQDVIVTNEISKESVKTSEVKKSMVKNSELPTIETEVLLG